MVIQVTSIWHACGTLFVLFAIHMSAALAQSQAPNFTLTPLEEATKRDPAGSGGYPRRLD